MSKCVICGKYVDKSYGSSTLFGIYCECCAVARGLTDEQMIFEMKQKIADLEAKLAESEREKQEFLIKYKYWRTEYEQLKQQLAEKNKEITKLKSDNHALMSDNAYQEADIFEFNSRIEQLQQQLAEKEKEIETLTKLKAKEMGKSLYGIVGSLEKITNESVNMAKSHQAIKGNVQ